MASISHTIVFCLVTLIHPELHLDSEENTGIQQIDIHRNLIKVPIYERQPATRQQAMLMVRRLEIRLKRIMDQVENDEIVTDDVLEVSLRETR
jgi:hypothetical protein